MASTPQKSKRDRGREHVGLPPKQHDPQRPVPAGFQCGRCYRVFEKAGTCCGQRTYPYYRAAGGGPQ